MESSTLKDKKNKKAISALKKVKTKNSNSFSKGRRFAQRRWRMRLDRLFFKSNTTEGKIFDTALLALIVLSLVVVMMQSVTEIDQQYGTYLLAIEMAVTVLFAIEYVLRVATSHHPMRYILSFYGIIDLLAFVPAIFSWTYAGSNFFLLLRVTRIISIFKVLDMNQYTGEAQILSQALRASRHKVTVFVIFVATNVVLLGFIMFLVEGKDNPGFSSIPKSIYWAIVTLTTVGYGDIAPQSALGRSIAAIVMILGYGVLAVPTGIVSAEIATQVTHKSDEEESEGDKQKTQATQKENRSKECSNCGAEHHSEVAHFCYKCGTELVL
ncbi:Kef-type K+ ransport system, predicted NAD-binding component [Bernardetia litoralis DSM 6794]|uniref:Kef-type K+ ransport system, predicted NAD-binding component n=1 Tax=Bernardetia litoralis (strain ATCC 23117 / DSM 6794 / NBRC 15988 / NCIMB 1366 / Fx l1 / Sio-4) TaxID=880071 RepID=I4AME8_BERLS|nr:ion transporter [Bernardetia litoralis]AFM05133.1 Kef-type K+ ransport system, predicted NAD-binding component [Bernardetia litoralis DSM 6794]